MEYLIGIFLVLAVYWKLKNLRLANLNLKYSFQLFKLRDQLRRLAIDGKVDADDWVFKYLDTSISKSVKSLPTLNIIMAIFLFKKHEEEANYVKFVKTLELALSRNEHLENIYKQYGFLMTEFILDQHFILKGIYHLTFWSISSVKSITSLLQSLRSMVESLRTLPETSTMNRYDHNLGYC